MAQNKAHQELLNQVLFAVGSMREVRLWKRMVGFDENRGISYGIKGESDLQGIIAPHGRMLAIEIKTGDAKLTKEQKLFRDMVLRFGGVYIEARSLDDAIRGVQEALRNERTSFSSPV